jgi:hypothetical protein
MRRSLFLSLSILCFGLFFAQPSAAVLAINRSVIAGGAVGASSATFGVRSTLGQDVVGPASSATFGLYAGFWNGGVIPAGVGISESSPVSLPSSFGLFQNVPNPFNPVTAIAYDVPRGVTGPVKLRIYGTDGRLVTTLVDGVEAPGTKTVLWSGLDSRGRPVASGVYYYTLDGPGIRLQQKMMLLK